MRARSNRFKAAVAAGMVAVVLATGAASCTGKSKKTRCVAVEPVSVSRTVASR
ncbi:hypothetical protein Q8791_27280 [Nocardiopsis sp. CT-R113]|uniref:Lipoprotein n=1 Tax=Nocardiopsis codii TaxID=3065942 RepID=A0ABU7KFB1_9ACTN|nr:hypothetical protein [Nocardiopsis sp. CT-R113]MEE2040929.1 hypothetical protein [Nocardiopsis sp. CT-R113]